MYWVMAPKILGDGSKKILPVDESIQVLSVQTGKLVGWVELEGEVGFEYVGSLDSDPLIVNGSSVWVHPEIHKSRDGTLEPQAQLPSPYPT